MNLVRRQLAVLAGSLTMWPSVGFAQPARKIARVYVLLPTRADEVTRRVVAAFKGRLAELGWREGSNIEYAVRYAEGNAANYKTLAAEAVAGKPDLVFVSFGPFAAVVKKHTADIPIVFMISQDPVAQGLVASLARPGGNATGVSTRSRELVGKRLQLIKEALPSMSKIGVVRPVGLPTSGNSMPLVEELKGATARLGLKLVEARHEHSKAGAFGPAFAQLVGQGVDAVATVLNWNYSYYPEFVQHAIQARLPTICDATEFVDAGGLMSFSASYVERWIKSADYVNRILRGAKPADLPVEEPTVFDLTVNLKTARALGLTIPQSILLRADRVIK
ncbi:MAG TPA: ABC transporter substrate-binding protein [Lacipirellulaceae bacterium]|jgi:putative ABC transport system substrate-binding protein|nr:ABC transporter substrate-binding protein [Lacipirellulaceae bacterium]